MGKCLFLRKGETHTAPISGILASDLAVGSIVKLMENGTAAEYLVVHQGLPSSLYDASCDGTWLLRKDCHSRRQWHTTATTNNYGNCALNTWLNGEFCNSFGETEQSIVKQVKIPYRAGNGTSKVVSSGASGLQVKAFLLSTIEMNLAYTYNPTNEGSCLSYFEGTPQQGQDEKHIAYYNGSPVYWWTRTPSCNANLSTLQIVELNPSAIMNSNVATSSYGIRPALIFPSNAIFDKNTLILKGVA